MSVQSPVSTITTETESRPVRAFVETVLSGSNNDIRVEWLMPGTVGNGKTLAGTFSGSYPAVSVALVGSAPVTGFIITGPIGTTAAQVLEAVANTPAVNSLSRWATVVGNTGAGAMVTFTALNFAGGTGTAPDKPISTIG